MVFQLQSALCVELSSTMPHSGQIKWAKQAFSPPSSSRDASSFIDVPPKFDQEFR
jgi:hypothetical protein